MVAAVRDDPARRVDLAGRFYDDRPGCVPIRSYRRALEIAPDYALAHEGLGLALKDKGQLDEAIEECRRAIALAPRLGVSEANATTVVVPLEEEPAPLGAAPAAAPASPLRPLTRPSDGSSAPKTLLNRPRVIAARKKTTR